MQKKIDLMSQILHQNNLGYLIPEGAKKKNPEDLNSKKDNSSHALIAINSSLDAWIIDSGASHHMSASKEVYSSLDACKGPPILMGDNSSVKVIDKGRIELTNGSFENVLHVPKLLCQPYLHVSDDEFLGPERNSYSHQISWTSTTCKPTLGFLGYVMKGLDI
jgi:hypothetical protein